MIANIVRCRVCKFLVLERETEDGVCLKCQPKEAPHKEKENSLTGDKAGAGSSSAPFQPTLFEEESES